MLRSIFYLVILYVVAGCDERHKPAILVQTDFGVKDGAVAAMKGVALSVDPSLNVYDLTHEIPAYNIWEAAYRLHQALPYWPAGTVIVSVVDPGVGTDRKSVVALTATGKYVVTPDNGTLTLIDSIVEVREIDESINRREGSGNSHTFHGRDVYMYTAAKLAAGKISFQAVGKVLKDSPVLIDFQKAHKDNDTLKGNIPILDIQYGNVWTNLQDSLVKLAGIRVNDSIRVKIFEGVKLVSDITMPFVNSFGNVESGKELAYINSIGNLALAINRGNYSSTYGIQSGPGWSVQVFKTVGGSR